MKTVDTLIDLKQLLVDILKQWKKILVVIAVTGIAAGVVGGMKQASIKPEVYSEEEIENIKENVKLAKRYKDKYESQLKYNTESLMMELDPYNVSREQISFIISSEDNEKELPKYVLESLANQYSNTINNHKTLSDISGVINVDSTYIKDIINVNVVEIEQIGDQSETGSIAYIIKVVIYGINQKMCDEIVDYYERELLSPKSNIVSDKGNHKIYISDRSYSVGYDQSFYDMQRLNITLLSSMKEAFDKQYSLLSDDEKNYLQYGQIISSDSNGKKDIIIYAIKYMIVGIIVGILLVCGFVCLRSLFYGRLQSANLVEEMTGVRTYICSMDDDSIKGIDRLISSLQLKIVRSYKKEELIKMINAELSIMRDKDDIKSVFITGSNVENDCVKEIIDNIRKEIEPRLEALYSEGSILDNADALLNIAKADRIIMVEKKDVSKIKDISRCINICDEYRSKITNYVVIN